MKVKKIDLISLLTVGILLVPARCLLAGDIVGTVKVSKPLQMIVYLEKVRGKFEPQRVIMDQKKMVFIPYVLPVVKGSTVEFHNGDKMYHGVFGVGAEEFALGFHRTTLSTTLLLRANVLVRIEGAISKKTPNLPPFDNNFGVGLRLLF